MRLHPALALCTLLSLPPLAVADATAPSAGQVMSEHADQIDNRIADIDYKRKRIVEANMDLDGKEAEAFWPIYNTYRSESDKLSKQHLALILDYARAYNAGSVSDDAASELIERAEKIQGARLELRNEYVARIAKAVSPKRAMRFLQIETQLDARTVLDIGRQVPLAE